MLWDLLVAYVVSLHFYNIVFIYLSRHGGHKESKNILHLLVPSRRYLRWPGVVTWWPAVSSCCSGTALIAVSALFSNNLYSSDLYIKYSWLSSEWFQSKHLIGLFWDCCVPHDYPVSYFGNHASKCVWFFLLSWLLLTFLCHLDTVPRFSNVN